MQKERNTYCSSATGAKPILRSEGLLLAAALVLDGGGGCMRAAGK